MKRGKFIQNGLLAAGAVVSGSTLTGFAADTAKAAAFKMNYAPHAGQFANHAGKVFTDQIKFMHDQGFKAIEDNGYLKRSVQEQEAIGNTLSKLGMTMGVFVVDGGDNWKTSLTTGKKEFHDNFIKTCELSVEAAKRCNAKWLTVVPGFFDRSKPLGIQTANVVNTLRYGSEIFEKAGLIMVIETLSDTPDLLLQKTDETYLVCKAVNSPSCKILYDYYHVQRNEGDLIATIDRCWDEIAYFQIGDNPGRKEPGTGEVNYKNCMRHLYNKGYKGVLGMEHGLSHSGKEGELKLINAYREIDSF